MARYNLRDANDYLAALDYINQMKEKGLDIELKKYSPSRSNRQNSYLHLILAYFAHCYGCTLCECKEIYFKQFACGDIFRVATPYGEYYRSTTELTKDEMSGAIRNFIAYADMHGIELPLADDYIAQRICEREIEKTTQFGT